MGTAGYHPNDQRETLSVFLPEFGLAFDAGTSAYRLAEYRQHDELTVLLSHAHLDHVVGLTFLLVPMLKNEFRRIRVLGQEEHINAVRTHLFAAPLFPVVPPYEFQSLSEPLTIAQGGMVTYCPLSHPGGSTGYRIDWPDRSFAFITDTTADPSAEYVDFIRGVDVLLHECNFPDSMAQWSASTGHSHATRVAEVAREAQVGALYLLHFDPQQTTADPVGINTIREIFPNAWLLEDRQLIELYPRAAQAQVKSNHNQAMDGTLHADRSLT